MVTETKLNYVMGELLFIYNIKLLIIHKIIYSIYLLKFCNLVKIITKNAHLKYSEVAKVLLITVFIETSSVPLRQYVLFIAESIPKTSLQRSSVNVQVRSYQV